MIATAQELGACNTQLTAKFGHTPTEVGIDTWRLVRYLDDDRDLARALSLCQDGGRGPALSVERPRGHVVGVLPGTRMLFIEGHPRVDSLAHPSTLPASANQVLQAVEEIGFPLGRDAGVGRADATVTLRYSDRRQGMAVLSGVAALTLPRSMPVVYGKPPQTVYFAGHRTAARKARVYDKGLESAVAPPGELVRFENQVRYSKRLRRPVQDVDLAHVRSRFQARFTPLARSAAGLTVASLPVIAARVAERIEAGEMRYQEAERLLGFMALHSAGPARGLPGRTMRRRRRELAEQGLVLADEFFEPVEVDLGETLESVLEAWANA